MKEAVTILNIPNYYCSYYLLGLSQRFNLSYRFDPKVSRFNNRAFLIFEYRGVRVVICNNDPSGTKPDLYEYVDYYFVTNKLKDHPDYQQDKIRPLFPHFPVDVTGLYLRTFKWNLLGQLKPSALLQQLHILGKRPRYQEKKLNYSFHNYVFFSANLWKKEPETNQIRAEFIRACKSDPRVNFEGGFVPREDGDTMGYPEEINQKIYPPKVFSELSAKTLFALNNPAVLGAVSWRLAEYFASGIAVISFPSAVDFPVEPEDQVHIHEVKSIGDFKSSINSFFENQDYHRKIAEGGYAYFKKYCTPEAQISYILKEINRPTIR